MFNITWKQFFPIVTLVISYVVCHFIKKSSKFNFQYFLQNFTNFPTLVSDMQPKLPQTPFFRKAWLKQKQLDYEQAVFQGDYMGQIDGQLYAPKFNKTEGMVSTYVELVGNLVTVFAQDKPTISMYIHPQDTILDIMQKFELPTNMVLVVGETRLEDLNKCLLQYGIKDNWKIDALVEPRDISFSSNLHELFNGF